MNSKQPKYRIDLLITENLANRHGMLPDHKILIALLKSGGPSRVHRVWMQTILFCYDFLFVDRVYHKN